MNSEENRKELARACGKYLLACRMASVGEVKQKVLSKPGKYKVLQENLHAKEVIIGDGERRRRYILCYNLRISTPDSAGCGIILPDALAKNSQCITTASSNRMSDFRSCLFSIK